MSTCTKSVGSTVWLLLLSEKHHQAVAAGAHAHAILHTCHHHHHIPHQEWQWVNVLPPRRDATALSEMLMARKNVPHSLQNATLPNSFTQEKLYCECLMPDTWDDMVMCDVCDVVSFEVCWSPDNLKYRKEQLICKEYMQSGSSVHSVCVCSLLFSNVVFAENNCSQCVYAPFFPNIVSSPLNNSLIVPPVLATLTRESKCFAGSPNISISCWNISFRGPQIFWTISSRRTSLRNHMFHSSPTPLVSQDSERRCQDHVF